MSSYVIYHRHNKKAFVNSLYSQRKQLAPTSPPTPKIPPIAASKLLASSVSSTHGHSTNSLTAAKPNDGGGDDEQHRTLTSNHIASSINCKQNKQLQSIKNKRKKQKKHVQKRTLKTKSTDTFHKSVSKTPPPPPRSSEKEEKNKSNTVNELNDSFKNEEKLIHDVTDFLSDNSGRGGQEEVKNSDSTDTVSFLRKNYYFS